MPQPFKCPSCGADLAVGSGASPVVQCPYCKGSAVVPELGRVGPLAPAPRSTGPAKSGGLIALAVIAAVLFALIAGVAVLFARLPGSATSSGYAKLLVEFGSKGMGPGQFEDPRGIAVDGAGNIYVANYQGGRVQMLDAAGKFLAQWSVGDPDAIITGFAGDREGHLYVVTTKSFDKRDGRTGKILQTYGTGYHNVALSQEGWMVVHVWASDDFVVMDRNGTITTRVKDPVSTVTGRNRGYSFESFAVDGVGNIYAVQREEYAVFKFSREGRYMNRYLGEGDTPEKLRNPHAIAVDGQGRMYVSDFGGVKVFDRDGVYLGIIETAGYIYHLAWTGAGELLTVGNANKVQKWELGAK